MLFVPIEVCFILLQNPVSRHVGMLIFLNTPSDVGALNVAVQRDKEITRVYCVIVFGESEPSWPKTCVSDIYHQVFEAQGTNVRGLTAVGIPTFCPHCE
jgi:hypothetical protein